MLSLFKIIAGFAVIVVLWVAFVFARVLGPAVEPARAPTLAAASVKLPDRFDATAPIVPKAVPTERILPPVAPAVKPPAAAVAQPDKPVAQPRRSYDDRRYRERYDGRYRERPSDVCSRHKMRKVVTRGGRSWRCKR